MPQNRMPQKLLLFTLPAKSMSTDLAPSPSARAGVQMRALLAGAETPGHHPGHGLRRCCALPHAAQENVASAGAAFRRRGRAANTLPSLASAVRPWRCAAAARRSIVAAGNRHSPLPCPCLDLLPRPSLSLRWRLLAHPRRSHGLPDRRHPRAPAWLQTADSPDRAADKVINSCVINSGLWYLTELSTARSKKALDTNGDNSVL
jgi:hypothetical protein